MTTTANTNTLPTLLDMIKRQDPNGMIAEVVEAMSKQNSVLQDAVFHEGNLQTGHKFTSRTALPSIAFRRFNEGVAPSKSKTDQITETTALMEAFSVVDKAEANLNGNAAAFRASEDASFLEALNQQAESTLIYGSSDANPEQFTGLLSRLTSTTGPAGKQIILHDGAASGNDQTSLLLVGWSPKTVFGIYPKGTKGGIEMTDLGERPWDPNGDGKKFVAYVTNWNWQLGLCVKDKRYLAAVRNIDMGNVSATGNLVIQSSVKAYHKILNPSAVRLAWYCNRDLATYLHLQALDSTKQSTLRIDQVAGQPVVSLMGIPLRISDQITSTESTVS